MEILAHLSVPGNSLTALEALEKFKCFRLAARINDLRRAGWLFHAEMVPTPSGKTVARYRLTGRATGEGEASG